MPHPPPTKRVLYHPRSCGGGGNSPSAAKFSFARQRPCLRKGQALRCPRRSSLDSSKLARSVPRRNSRNPHRTGSEPHPNILSIKKSNPNKKDASQQSVFLTNLNLLHTCICFYMLLFCQQATQYRRSPYG